jgi:hypothetical protein
MSVLGQKRRFNRLPDTSGLPPGSGHRKGRSPRLKGATCRQVAPDTRSIAARVEAGLTSVRILNSEAAEAAASLFEMRRRVG